MKHARHTFASLLPRSDLTIGPRLTVCFLAIVVLMIAADAVVIWQVHQLAAQTQVLNAADKASSAIVRLHLDVNSFSGRVAALTRSHDSRQFASEAALLTTRPFCGTFETQMQALRSSPEIAQDRLISSALKTLTTTLPSQIDSEIEFANGRRLACYSTPIDGTNPGSDRSKFVAGRGRGGTCISTTGKSERTDGTVCGIGFS